METEVALYIDEFGSLMRFHRCGVVQFVSTVEAESVRSAASLAYHDLSAKIVEVLIKVFLTVHGGVSLHDDLRITRYNKWAW